MKIYWKNILYNYTVRYIHILNYYISGDCLEHFSRYLYPPKRFETENQKDKFLKELNIEAKKYFKD